MKRFLVAIGCLSLLCSIASANYWCDCSLKTPKQRFAAADSVFIGTVLEPGQINRGGATAHFKVTRTLKGQLPEKILVGYDAVGDQAVQFEKGKSYLVYVVGDLGPQNGVIQNGLMTDSCCGTKAFSLAKDDLATINSNSSEQK